MNIAAWVSRILGVTLSIEEAEVFVAAAGVLLPAHFAAALAARSDDDALHAALRSLWARSGRAEAAPMLMPEQPMSPGVIGAAFQQLFARLLPVKRRL